MRGGGRLWSAAHEPQARSCGGGSDADRRRALALLAGPRDSCTEAIVLAHGFTVDQMVELVVPPRRPSASSAGRATSRSPACGSPTPGCGCW